MDILIPDLWLRDYLATKATPDEIAKNLSTGGPSVERILKSDIGAVYSIEVTTNRIDCASVYGIAREAGAILNNHNIKAGLKKIKPYPYPLSKTVDYLSVKVDPHLCSRFTAVLIKDVKIKPSPKWLTDRLKAVGVRAINNVVDISNYIMHDLGQPLHTFDYDKITNHQMNLRESRKGEKVTTLDGKTHLLPGGDIVIEDGSGQLIDLAGIMGGENTAIDNNTKNVLLFIQTYNPVNIRKTSMTLALRSEAAVLFEKGIDEKLIDCALGKTIQLMGKLTQGVAEKAVLNIYPVSTGKNKIVININEFNKKLGTNIKNEQIIKILRDLDFNPQLIKENISVTVPSYRSRDIQKPYDLIEEVARIYGYENIPNKIMDGEIPLPLENSPFNFERKIKMILKGYGGIEIYTLSLVSGEFTLPSALKLTNPLGSGTAYLRTSLAPSLVSAAITNIDEKNPFHLFEMANIYITRKRDLPEEKMMVAGITHKTDYSSLKGIVEALLKELSISYRFVIAEENLFVPGHLLYIKGKEYLGKVGILESRNFGYWEFDVQALRKSCATCAFHLKPDYPPQIEDLTFMFPEKTHLGEVIEHIRKQNCVSDVALSATFEGAVTLRIHYQHPQKTLNNKEVEGIRNKILKNIHTLYGGKIKN